MAFIFIYSNPLSNLSLKNTSASFTTPRQIEMGPKGYTKGDTLVRLMKNFGWSKDEVFVFGDGGYDISMFKQTNYSFAMGQALESVKNEARYITLSNDEDGIYEALMKFNVIKGV